MGGSDCCIAFAVLAEKSSPSRYDGEPEPNVSGNTRIAHFSDKIPRRKISFGFLDSLCI